MSSLKTAMTSMSLVFSLGLMGTAPFASAAGETTLRHLAVPNRGQLELQAPASWRDKAEPIKGVGLPTITFHPVAGPEFEVLVSAIRGPAGSDFNSQAKVREQVERAGQAVLPMAVETKLVIKELAGQTGKGYYFSVTDRAPKLGEYKYMTQGEIGVGDLLLTFTILSHEKEGKVLQDALAMLAGAKQQAGSAASASAMKSYALSLPASDWSLVMDLSGFDVVQERTAPDNQAAYFMATNESTGVAASAFLETIPDMKTAQACREFYWSKASKSPLTKTDIRLFDMGQAALVEWTVPEFNGVKVQQKNINAYMAYKGACIDLHLSKAPFQAADQKLFDHILHSVIYRSKKSAL